MRHHCLVAITDNMGLTSFLILARELSSTSAAAKSGAKVVTFEHAYNWHDKACTHAWARRFSSTCALEVQLEVVRTCWCESACACQHIDWVCAQARRRLGAQPPPDGGDDGWRDDDDDDDDDDDVDEVCVIESGRFVVCRSPAKSGMSRDPRVAAQIRARPPPRF